jgi:hypothetical protein
MDGDISGTCSTQRREVKGIQCFTQDTLKERDHNEDLNVYGTIILKWIIETYDSNYGLGPVYLPFADSCEHRN